MPRAGRPSRIAPSRPGTWRIWIRDLRHNSPMSLRENADPRARLATLHTKLIGWLVNEAYPRWAQYGIDPKNGGFIEALGQDGLALPHPRRARVHPRQIYPVWQPPALGWCGAATRGPAPRRGYLPPH